MGNGISYVKADGHPSAKWSSLGYIVCSVILLVANSE